MSFKKLIASIALGTLMINTVSADDDVGGIYRMDDEGLNGILYLAPTGRYYLGATMLIGSLAALDFSSTGTWRSEKKEICIEPLIAPYRVFAATVAHGKPDLPPDAVGVFVEELEGVGNEATTFFSVGAKFPGRRVGGDDTYGGDQSYLFAIKPDDTQGYLRITYEDSDYVYDFPLNPKYNAYRVVNSGQIGFDSTSSKVVNAMILEFSREEITSLDKMPSCGPLNKKLKRLPPEVSDAEKKEYMKNMVENVDPQKITKDGVTYTRIPLRFLETMPASQEGLEE
jgi:hypothetical protein